MLHADSVAYYESTVTDVKPGIDGYYSEDGTAPASAWTIGRSEADMTAVAQALGVESGQRLGEAQVRGWFNRSVAPSGLKLGRRLGSRGRPGFDLTFCAPKSVSLLWGFDDEGRVRDVVNDAQERAVEAALGYLTEHAGYTRRASDEDRSVMVIEKLPGLSGVRYEHKTSRAGDPHVHTHALLANKQICRDGKVRTLDSKGLFHESRAAGMIYQATLRQILTEQLGVQWGEVVNGCAEIIGLDAAEMIDAFSTRSRDIDRWLADNDVIDPGQVAALGRMGQKITRRAKDLEVSLSTLEQEWGRDERGVGVREFVAALTVDLAPVEPTPVADEPSIGEVLSAVTAARSTFTRADVVEAVADAYPVGAAASVQVHARIEAITDQVMASGAAWSLNPDQSREWTLTAREGAQRFTTEEVVEEVNDGIDLACERIEAGVSPASIEPVDGALSHAQAEAMAQIVASPYRASVLIAPAGAGKTSSLKAARGAWEQAGKRVVGLAPTGKAADVMVAEQVAAESSTIARALYATADFSSAGVAGRLGWDADTVVVVDEAGMVATAQLVRLLEVAKAAGARLVVVGDPHQYSAVKARSGLLATLAYELPDTAELTEVFRQVNPGERAASTWLRDGEEADVERAANWYAAHDRLHAGTHTAMVADVLTGWAGDIEDGYDALMVASTREDVAELNRLAQKVLLGDDAGVLPTESARLSGTARACVGDVVMTRRNDYELVTAGGQPVRNGQRWQVTGLVAGGGLELARLDDPQATVTLPGEYVCEHVELGYAVTGHASQGATVDTCHVLTGLGQVDRAGVYVPMTRGRHGNHLYLAERVPGDPDTSPYDLVCEGQHREDAGVARDLLIAAACRDRADVTPQDAWRQGYVDFDLARLSSPQSVSEDPYAGTRMAEVMAQRRSVRAQRARDFHEHPPQAVAGHQGEASPQAAAVGQVEQPVLVDPETAQAQNKHAKDELADALERRAAAISRVEQARQAVREAEDQVRAFARELERSRQRLENLEATHGAKPKGLRGFLSRGVDNAEEIAQTRQQIAETARLLAGAEADRDHTEASYDGARQHQQEAEDGYALAQARHASAFTADILGGGLNLGEAIAAQSARGRRSNSTAQTPTYEFDNETSRGQETEL